MTIARGAFISALMLTLAVAAPAAAQTTLLEDDMEGAIEAKWIADAPTDQMMEPWQRSDSGAPKYRGNQFRGGAASYWAGLKPEGMHPTDVIEGDITLTAKQPILIPADGKTSVSFWSLFQNEGDDRGTFEAALATDTQAPGAWKKVAEYKPEPTEVTDPEYTPGYCVPRPETLTQGFEEVKGDFSAFAGAIVLVRFNLQYGPENRAPYASPCGWYVDDLKVTTTGTPSQAPAPPGPTAGAPPTIVQPATKPAVRFARKLKTNAKQATLSLRVANRAINRATVTLLKRSRRLATTKVATIPTGPGRIVFKLKRKLKKGTYEIKLTGTPSTGGSFTTTGKTKV